MVWVAACKLEGRFLGGRHVHLIRGPAHRLQEENLDRGIRPMDLHEVTETRASNGSGSDAEMGINEKFKGGTARQTVIPGKADGELEKEA